MTDRPRHDRPFDDRPRHDRPRHDRPRHDRPMLAPPADAAGPTDAWRLVHGAASGAPGWYVDRLGDYLLSQSQGQIDPPRIDQLERWRQQLGAAGAYHKRLDRQQLTASPEQVSPTPLLGDVAPPRFEVRENGVRFEVSFVEGYSVGLFLDQRDNRRRLLTGLVTGGFSLSGPAGRDGGRDGGRSRDRDRLVDGPLAGLTVLNTFAYTCSFSVCAAMAGATTTSLDLSRKYLDWGRDNFRRNGLDPAGHDFIYGDCFNWLKRLARKGRRFDLIILDPPTFSRSKESGVFRAEADYGRLVASALALLPSGGVLLASTNAARLRVGDWLAQVRGGVASAGRRVQAEFLPPPPADFPATRAEPAYLKTAWLRVG